jgi:tyrosine decarboxylase/aspartate 1-decarboxylase
MGKSQKYSFEKESLQILRKALDRLDGGFETLPHLTAHADWQKIEQVLLASADRLKENYPYFHPLYAGQMLKPPHPVARIAYALSMWINPNNHALDGGRASSAMEKEAVAEIARMVGWETHLGHLTSGGTMANLEALWIAGLVRPDMTVVASDQAHYTHHRITGVLRLKSESIGCDRNGRMDLTALKRRLEHGGVGTVVATMGTTATGSVDPLSDLLELRAKYGFRIHADAAYGGYFKLIDNLDRSSRLSFDALSEVDSLVIDPHKHGLQPYGCGCILFRDPSAGKFYKHESPYTYFTSTELHLGEISLECSRPGAAAVGLWATQRLLPLVRVGEFAKGLSESRQAALELFGKIRNDVRFITAFPPELDIIVWAPRAATISEISLRSKQIFHEAARQNLHLALVELPVEFFDFSVGGIQKDRETMTCLRSVLMKPEHLAWVDSIWQILDRITPPAGK